jgi:hypothetical protein
LQFFPNSMWFPRATLHEVHHNSIWWLISANVT